MVQVTILSRDKNTLEDIAAFLLKEKMIIKANIDWDRNRYLNENGLIVKQKVHILTCVSKSLLFNEISNYLNQHFPNETPEIYSTAIVNMDWKLSQLLIEQIKKV
jgi:uncharacterized protein involved in tolerance to divalent cations